MGWTTIYAVDWGDVPTWISAGGAVTAVLFAGYSKSEGWNLTEIAVASSQSIAAFERVQALGEAGAGLPRSVQGADRRRRATGNPV